MATARVREGLPERGVYEAPFLVEGHDALLAVNSLGVVRKVAKLLPGLNYGTVRAALEAWLDGDDPLPSPPKLELVRDRPATSKPPRPLHPAHANEFRAYRNRLIQQTAHRVKFFRD